MRRLGFIIVLLWLTGLTYAQSDLQNRAGFVFIQHDIDSSGTDRLIFVDTLTGEETETEVFGERYTIAGHSVMFFNPATRQVMLARPDGSTRAHPFIQPDSATRRVDWLISNDGTRIAWTFTTGDPNFLTTTTSIANLDGTEPRQVLVDGPRAGIRMMPVAFHEDGETLYMDYQPDAIGDLTPFRQYAGLFTLDLKTSIVNYLPDEPGCFCGAGIGAGLFLRLSLTNDLSGFDLNVYHLPAELNQRIPALRLNNYTQAGDILISPDGSRAVYALAQITNFGTQNQATQTVFLLVDLRTMTQAALTQPLSTFLHPIAWTDDNTAVLFTSPDEDGTWKVNLNNGGLIKIADAAYLGMLR